MKLSTPNLTGTDQLVISLTQNAWYGDARFTVAVDGKQIGGVYTARTAEGAGTDTLTLRGNWGTGKHDLAITFINDAWGGHAGADRNLHIEGVSYNGKAVAGATADLHSNGTAHLDFGGSTPSGPTKPAHGDLPATKTVWVESFDHGTGSLSRVWGPGVDTSVPGQITLHSTPDNQDSGAMVPPTGAKAGFGYGLYSFTLKMSQGDVPGPYALLWPGTDQWPGPELDLVEILRGGTAYSTVHWKGANNSNQYASHLMPDVDPKQVHTYSMLWEPGRLTGYVDGEEKWTTTAHVPADAAHGGQNLTPGLGMQTWWSAADQHGNGYQNAMTVYEVSYSVIA